VIAQIDAVFLRQAAQEAGLALDETFVQKLAAMLGAWLDDGLLIGSKLESSP